MPKSTIDNAFRKTHCLNQERDSTYPSYECAMKLDRMSKIHLDIETYI